ncbi:hypothetical protein BDZ89DRAFT_1044546 [Hymenopellis radicata]|nr:hypothetical protein BDZ89DRAFT_1044546 [Hymenopellis radicata]
MNLSSFTGIHLQDDDDYPTTRIVTTSPRRRRLHRHHHLHSTDTSPTRIRHANTEDDPVTTKTLPSPPKFSSPAATTTTRTRLYVYDLALISSNDGETARPSTSRQRQLHHHYDGCTSTMPRRPWHNNGDKDATMMAMTSRYGAYARGVDDMTPMSARQRRPYNDDMLPTTTTTPPDVDDNTARPTPRRRPHHHAGKWLTFSFLLPHCLAPDVTLSTTSHRREAWESMLVRHEPILPVMTGHRDGREYRV